MDIETLYRTILESPKIIKNEDDVTNDHLLELKQYIVSKDAELSAIAETVSPLCRDIDIAKALSVGLQRMALQLEQMSVIVDAEVKRREGCNNEPPKAEPPAFADLFVSAEAMEKALEAARAVGLIEGNAWVYTGKDKVKKLRIWYTAALRWGLAKGGISTKRATNMMKEGIHFDRLHKDAVQAIPLLEIDRDHDNKNIYNTMLAIMRK